MDDSTESCVPPGFRFHPTDQELVGYYLKKKVASQKIDLDVIRDIDLYRIEPWDLQEKCRMGYEEQNEWYFFSHKDKKYPTGTRTNRATMAGFWKATGRDKAVYDKSKLIGMRKTLVFYKGRAPNGQKTDWIMHEYRLESDENGPPLEEGWVVCRAFTKRKSVQSKNIDEGWDSSYVCDETTNGTVSSVIDPISITDLVTKQPPNEGFFCRNNNNLLCKQEMGSEAALANFMHLTSVDPFLELPQLESPSQPPLLKRVSKSSISPVSASNNNDNNNNNNNNNNSGTAQENIKEKVTDWRALDKFVASQLSQDPDDEFVRVNHDDCQRVPSLGHHYNEECGNTSNMEALLLLHASNGREDDNLVNGLLGGTSSSGDCDNIGICIFDKL